MSLQLNIGTTVSYFITIICSMLCVLSQGIRFIFSFLFHPPIMFWIMTSNCQRATEGDPSFQERMTNLGFLISLLLFDERSQVSRICLLWSLLRATMYIRRACSHVTIQLLTKLLTLLIVSSTWYGIYPLHVRVMMCFQGLIASTYNIVYGEGVLFLFPSHIMFWSKIFLNHYPISINVRP